MSLLSLDYVFEHVSALDAVCDPLEIFSIFKSFQKSLKTFSIFFDKDKLCVKVNLKQKRIYDINVLRGVPIPLLNCETFIISNDSDSVCCNCREQIRNGGLERVLSLDSELENYDSITFMGLFKNIIPKDLTDLEKITLHLYETDLLGCSPTEYAKTFELIHFGNLLKLEQRPFFEETSLPSFQIIDESLGCGIQIFLVEENKSSLIKDLVSPQSKGFEHYFLEKFPQFRKIDLSFQVLIWHEDDSFLDVGNYYISKPKIEFLEKSHSKLSNFLESKVVQDAVARRQNLRNEIAGRELSERKQSVHHLELLNLPDGSKFRVPSNEQETVCLFMMLVGSKSTPFNLFQLHEYVTYKGIDAICSYKLDSSDVIETVATEFEFTFSNFLNHRHPLQHTELIICWIIDKSFEGLENTKRPWLKILRLESRSIRVVEILKFPEIIGI